jgi:hypothetical protein
MNAFRPSRNFVPRVMTSVREYEATADRQEAFARALLYSRPVILTLSAAGLLLGIWNALRIAFILLSPSMCM